MTKEDFVNNAPITFFSRTPDFTTFETQKDFVFGLCKIANVARMEGVCDFRIVLSWDEIAIREEHRGAFRDRVEDVDVGRRQRRIYRVTKYDVFVKLRTLIDDVRRIVERARISNVCDDVRDWLEISLPQALSALEEKAEAKDRNEGKRGACFVSRFLET